MKAEPKSLFVDAWNRFGDHLELAEIHREVMEILKIIDRLDRGGHIRSRHEGVLVMLKEARNRLFVLDRAFRSGSKNEVTSDSSERSETFLPTSDCLRFPLRDISGPTFSGDPTLRYNLDDAINTARVNEASSSLLDAPTSNLVYESSPVMTDSSASLEPTYDSATAGVVVEGAKPDVQSPPLEPWKADTRTYKAVIELLDLLDKARIDERMGTERMIRNLARKRGPLEAVFGLDATDSDNQDAAQDVARSLLEWISQAEESSYEEFLDGLQRLLERICACLGLERIDRRGPFDVADQHILEMVDTDDPSLDQTIEGTVECGFRIGDWVLRPQKVFVYWHKAQSDPSTTIQGGTP